MDTFGKKIAALRKAGKMSQAELAKALNTSTSVIGRYERDEMVPSIDAAKKIAVTLNTTVGYLLGEVEQADVFKDPDMLKRLSEIQKMDKEDKGHILSVIDGFIKSIKLKNIAAL
ncbi:helix-turn-helix transcriptional regulator [Seonamhaeicola sp.]|uniref:helix-turn-helix domain-containing protein n=1 Tax=Seonamhaeicola sp. TaxID=1912245 RepID=UPI002620F8ED|nr:helix-turn-helix transcriptional regulator [Seonamhaeicola sp.]